MFLYKDINNIISSYLNKDDNISLLKVNKNLYRDLGYVPHKNFVFDYKFDDIRLKLFLKYANFITSILVIDCEFFFCLTIDVPNLKELCIKENDNKKIKIYKPYNLIEKIYILNDHEYFIDHDCLEHKKYLPYDTVVNIKN